MSSIVSKIPHGSDRELWVDVKDYLPKGNSLSWSGVYLDNSDPVLISGPCWVSALTRSQDGNDWGIVIHWIDQDEKHRHSAFPISRLHDRGCSLATDLASLGLKVIPGKHRHLMEYLAGFELPKDHRLQSVSKLGWQLYADGSMVYVLPDDLISFEKSEDIIFQPEQHSPTTNTMTSRGNVSHWSKYVAKSCSGNPKLIFGLCTSFSAPLLLHAGLEGGGFHLYGGSSKGKTTCLQIAASVCGNGADPAASENSYVGRWNTTANALEGTAAAHNDGLLALDEMGACDAKDFGKVVYDLSSGQGKARMNKNTSMRQNKAWRSIIFSTGEISSRQKIEESGKKAQIGHEVRMVDIPIADGLLIDTHGQDAGDFANELKKNAGQYYGTALREFIAKLINYESNHFALKKDIVNRMELCRMTLTAGRKLHSHQQRVIQRFTLLIVAGQLAVKFGLLPMTEQEITESIKSVLNSWIGDESNLPPDLRGINDVKNFFIANRDSRFKSFVNGENFFQVRDIAGYIQIKNGEELVLFTQEGFIEACNGHSFQAVLKEFKKRGFLKHEKDKLTDRFAIPGISKRMSLYAIRKSFVDDDLL